MSRRTSVLVALLVLLTAPGKSQQTTLVLTHVTVIDGTGATPKTDQTVIISGGRISAVGRPRVPAGTQVIDAQGKFLIPGLWDMHVHLALAGERSLPLLAANGVTSVRDAGGDLDRIRAWREKIAAGDLVGPRIKGAGDVLESASWKTRIEQKVWPILEKNGIERDHEWGYHIGVATPAEAQQAVEKLSAQGVDFVKSRTCESRDVFLAIAAAAKRAGLPFATHPPPSGVSLADASDAGLLSLEHFGFAEELDKLGDSQRQALYARLVKNETWLDPTTVSGVVAEMSDAEVAAAMSGANSVNLPEELAASFRRDIKLRTLEAGMGESPAEHAKSIAKEIARFNEMHRAGVRFLAGTDLAALLVFPGESLHTELQLLVERIGLTPMEALISATRHPAEYFHMEKSLGTIETGKVADLVLLDANPLDDIRNTRRIRAVIVGGKMMDRAKLDRVLQP